MQEIDVAEQCRRTIIRVREILRSMGITGMDSMRHICTYLLLRFITRDRARALHLEDSMCWEAILESAQEPGARLQLGPSGVFEGLQRLFGSRSVAWDITSQDKHREIVALWDKVDVARAEAQMDVLGFVYEQHLKTGATAARDLGQFFTDRAVCQYMTRLCQPQLNDARPEYVCDPSMGTGGFLATYIESFADRGIDWRLQQSQVAGWDTDATVAGIARMNLFLKSGGTFFANLRTADSLQGGLERPYDIILANMPFGIKALNYADCCTQVRAMGIPGNKSEPLFLQLMMGALAPGGRCAVVVPEGVLVNENKLHVGTRRYLLDRFELERVVALRGKMFLNTAIETKILFFRNTGRPTTSIAFGALERDPNSSGLRETWGPVVSRALVDADPSLALDPRRWAVRAAAVPRIFPPEFRRVRLADIATVEIGGTPARDRPEFWDRGTHLWVTVKELRGQVVHDSTEKITDLGIRRSSVKAVRPGSVLFSFKLSIGKCAIAGRELYTNEAIAAIHTKDETRALNQYLFYVLAQHDYSSLAKGTIGAGNMNKTSVGDIPVLLPPIEVQMERVKELDALHGLLESLDQFQEKVRGEVRRLAQDPLALPNRGWDRMKSLIQST